MSNSTKTYTSPFQKTEPGAARQRITLAPIGGTSVGEFLFFSDRVMVESDFVALVLLGSNQAWVRRTGW